VLTAFFGLTMIIAADPAVAGLAVGGALCRRYAADYPRDPPGRRRARRHMVHHVLVNAGFFALSLLAWSWHQPHGAAGWTAFIGIAFAVPVGSLLSTCQPSGSGRSAPRCS
jgi:alpha-beta hydrolase superfamily lysophospholipase